jgi:tetratricopeptide (TPR) repeat protein
VKARDAIIQLGMTYRRADDYERAAECLNEALAESRAMRDEHRAADTLYHLGTVMWSEGRNREAIPFHQEAVEICERSGLADLVAVQAYHGRGEAHFANAEPKAAIACYTRSLELARGIGDRSYESENLMMIGHACTGAKGLGDYPRALAHFEAALGIARAADLQWHLGPTLLGAQHVRACTGHYGEAWTGMIETLHWLESVHHVRYQLIAYDFLGHLLLDLDLNEQAAETMARGLALGRATGINFWRAGLDAALAIARTRLGQRGIAADVEAALDRSRHNAERYMTTRCLEALAEIALTAGDAGRCRGYADELLALAEANGLRELEACARRWRGEALLADKAHAAAQGELSRAAAIASDIGRTRLRLDIEAALARTCAAQRKRAAAQQHEGNAQAIAEAIAGSLGASGLESRLQARGGTR